MDAREQLLAGCQPHNNECYLVLVQLNWVPTYQVHVCTLLHTERVERLIYMNVDTPGSEFGKGALSSEITYLGKIRYLPSPVSCRVCCRTHHEMGQNLQSAEANQDHLPNARLDREHGIFFSPISLDSNLEGFCLTARKRKKKPPIRALVSLSCSSHETVRAAKTTTGWNECCVA